MLTSFRSTCRLLRSTAELCLPEGLNRMTSLDFTRSACGSPHPKRGFTLIELLTVVTVIMVLMGMGIPAMGAIRRSQQRQGAAVLIASVATAMRQYDRDVWWVPAANMNIRMWDWNGDQILDGDPMVEAVPTGGPTAAQVVSSGYRGALSMLRLDLPTRLIDKNSQRIVDPWKKSLRIAFATKVYGEADWGLWSGGPSGGAAPDITSWVK